MHRAFLAAALLMLAACSADADATPAPAATVAPIWSSTTTTSVGSIPTDVTGTPDPTGAPVIEVTLPTPVLPDGSPVGFGTTAALVTEPDGTECEICLWLAVTPAQRAKGLKFATNLAGAAGMAFRYPSPHTGTFWMKNVQQPLSIAFYSADGDYLDAFDMPTCFDSTCFDYATPPDFVVAVEVPQGELDRYGLVAGSSIELLDVPCLTP
jgi:uncharacterized membrane protein (UPF0127 family)